MNKKATARSSSLFLIELMMAILFFSVTAGICVQFFVKARLMSQDAVYLNAAVSDCTSAAEAIQASESLAEVEANLMTVYPEAVFGTEDGSGDGDVAAAINGSAVDGDVATDGDGSAVDVGAGAGDASADGAAAGAVYTGALTSQLSVTFSLDGDLLTATLVYQLEGETDPVYSLTVEKYLAGGAS